MTDPRMDISQKVAGDWVRAFLQLLQSTAAQEYTGETGGLEDCGGGGDRQAWTWWSQESSICNGPALWVGASNESWTTLGNAILSALGVEEAESSDSLSTIKDLVAQATSTVIQGLSQQFRTAITSGSVMASAPPAGQAMTVRVLGRDKSQAAGLQLFFHDAFFEALAKLSAATSADAAPAAALRPEPAGPPEPIGSPEPAAAPYKPLPGTLADLKLPVHVNLAKTTLRLGNILKLTAGSVLDLNRSTTDLTEIVINGRVIASGRVVVCNGSYAVEVTHSHIHQPS